MSTYLPCPTAERTSESAPLPLTKMVDELPAWTVRLQADLTQSIRAQCGPQPKKGGAARTFESRFGPITVRRTRGWCRHCYAWRYPADAALGLADTAGYSPGVQEIAALGVSKLPVAEASAVIERLAGVKLQRATLDREARRQRQRAGAERAQLDAQMRTEQGHAQQVRELQMELPLEPFTLVLELDAWNISERDDEQWGHSAQLRAAGTEPDRWRWIYGATCFRLRQRAQTTSGRPVILSRGYVMTRGGIDALREQLFAEASRHGLGQARDVLVVADGALWIWNLVDDRFPQARQRLDLFHAKQHLWAVAEALHGAGTSAAQAWLKPLLAQLEGGQTPRLLENLHAALAGLKAESRTRLERSTILKTTERGTTTWTANVAASRWVVARWNRPAGNINAASSVPASSGRKLATKR